MLNLSGIALRLVHARLYNDILSIIYYNYNFILALYSIFLFILGRKKDAREKEEEDLSTIIINNTVSDKFNPRRFYSNIYIYMYMYNIFSINLLFVIRYFFVWIIKYKNIYRCGTIYICITCIIQACLV